MKLYEFEAKTILARYGVPVPQGALITNASRAEEAVAELEQPFAVKAQVLVVGRGKAGGILFADSVEEVEEPAKKTAGCKLGIMSEHFFEPGSIGVASTSGTLTYEVAASLTKNNFGQSTCVGIGGDPVTDLNFIDVLELFRDYQQTEAVVLIGEIGGNIEELTGGYLSRGYTKPVVAYVAGRFAPPEKHMGHAGAIVIRMSGTAENKIKAFEDASVHVAEKPGDVAGLLTKAIET